MSYEVHTSNGKMVFELKQACSKDILLVLDKGDYTIEATLDNNTKQAKFTVGDGSSLLLLDLSNLNHEEEIKADTPSN